MIFVALALVALALVAALVVTVAAFAGLLRSQQRSHARREDLILNQLLHATNHTWQPPPADTNESQPPPEQYWSASPEQSPVY